MFYLCGLVHHIGPVDINIQAKCDPCLSNPCKNDGTCANDPVHYYRCTCPYGFKVHTAKKAKGIILTCPFIASFIITHWYKKHTHTPMRQEQVNTTLLIFQNSCRVQTYTCRHVERPYSCVSQMNTSVKECRDKRQHFQSQLMQ